METPMRVLATASTLELGGLGFLGLYAMFGGLALGVTLIVQYVLRWRRLATVDLAMLSSRPVDVAYLREGERLAVVAACGALEACGALGADPSRGALGQAVMRPVALPPEMPPLGRLTHRAPVEPPLRIRGLLADPEVTAELRAIDERLVTAGLLLSHARRRARSLLLLPWLALLGYGLVAGIVAAGFGIANTVPYILLLLNTLWVMALAVDTRPANRLGRKTAANLAGQHRALKTQHESGYHTHASAALCIALYGADRFWDWAPELARSLGLSKPPSENDDGGGGDGDGGGD